MTEERLFDPGLLRRICHDVAEAMGAPGETAAEVARHLVMANLSGHDSHGVIRLAQYAGERDRGQLVPEARVELLQSSAACALFDAQRGFGHRSTMVATEWVAEHAKQNGLAAAAVRHSTHIGRLGEYTERLAREGLVGLVTVGIAGPGSGRVAPFGGVEPFLGTNPWSMGVPAADRPPLIFDAATSTIAEGKVRVALARGVQVPPGTVIDAEGRPTLDAAQLYSGGTLTLLGGDLAGHKGFGLSMAAALIGGLAIIGDPDPTSAGTMQRGLEQRSDRVAGAFVVGIDPGSFGDAGEYRSRVAMVLDALAAAAPAPGRERVLVPGDPERISRERREREGIPLAAPVWEGLAAVAARFGVATA